MAHKYFSERAGLHPHPNGLPLQDVIGLFVRVYDQLTDEGYFTQAFGYFCVDNGRIAGSVPDVDLEILLSVRKSNLWPIDKASLNYSEDDFFDIIEFLFQHVTSPVSGTPHNWGDCGMHWETFNRPLGQKELVERVNRVLDRYEHGFELSAAGEVLKAAEHGFEEIFKADVPSKDKTVLDRMNAAVVRFRHHGSSLDDRRHAVRDLADVLEKLRPQMQGAITSKDEGDLFNIANSFGIRHVNDKQKTNYDVALWLSWMFYFYLSTIHVVLRKLQPAAERLKATKRAARIG